MLGLKDLGTVQPEVSAPGHEALKFGLAVGAAAFPSTCRGDDYVADWSDTAPGAVWSNPLELDLRIGGGPRRSSLLTTALTFPVPCWRHRHSDGIPRLLRLWLIRRWCLQVFPIPVRRDGDTFWPPPTTFGDAPPRMDRPPRKRSKAELLCAAPPYRATSRYRRTVHSQPSTQPLGY